MTPWRVSVGLSTTTTRRRRRRREVGVAAGDGGGGEQAYTYIGMYVCMQRKMRRRRRRGLAAGRPILPARHFRLLEDDEDEVDEKSGRQIPPLINSVIQTNSTLKNNFRHQIR